MSRIKGLAVFMLSAAFLAAPACAAANKSAFELGMESYNKARYRQAAAYFKRALKDGLKEEELRLARYMARIARESRGYLDGLEREEREFRSKGPSDVRSKALAERHLVFAIILMRDEFYLGAVEPHMKRAIELNPKDREAYFQLGNACYAAMRYFKAVENYEKTIELDPGFLYAYKLAGDASVALGDFDKAKKFYSGLIEKDSQAAAKYDKEELEKVKKVMRILPQTYKDVSALMNEERTDEAELILKKRISLNSADYIAMAGLGNIYQERGDRKTALELFERAKRIAPDYPLTHLYLGRLLYLMRRPEEAVAELRLFKEKMKLLPKMDEETKKLYMDGLRYIEDIYFELKMFEEYHAETEEILKLEPKDQSALYNVGLYYYLHKHNRPKAYEAFRKAFEADHTTYIARKARYAIEYMRQNPDSRVIPDFSFIDREYRD